MCGICGIVHRDRGYPILERDIVAMRDVLDHRGPDDAGIYLEPGIGLGSRRLAILDLSERGHMPMASPDARYWITYNGEVYSYPELRASLEARGHRFRSGTDTEAVLAAYAEHGPSMVEQLNGMFAMAIWDTRERTLFLARDRLGKKPLYYTIQDGCFYFASEEKALFAAGIEPSFDSDTWEELLCFRYVAGERTPFRGVRRLLPGHWLIWKDGEIQTRRWWNLAARTRALRESPPEDPVRWFRVNFDSAVNVRRLSDVPLGVLLSGGLDSSSLAASLSAQAGSGVASFTVRFDEPGYDEGPLAKTVADRWNLDYHDLLVRPGELMSLLRCATYYNDEPLVHGNDQHLLAISRYAKSRVTVLLSGEGADELLAGYVRYQPLRHPALLRLASSVLPAASSALGLNGRIGKLSRFLSMGSLRQFVLHNSCDLLPGELGPTGFSPSGSFPYREGVLDEAESLYPGEFSRQAMYSDQHTFLCSILDRNDRMTMGASIECRVPFLDYRLVEGAAALPSSVLLAGVQSKTLLRKSLGSRLPEGILRHRKWGFGVPWQRHFREVPEFRDWIQHLPDAELIRTGPFDRTRMRNIVDSYLGGDGRYHSLIRQFLMIAIWADVCLRKP